MIAEHPMPTIHDVRSYWDSHPLFSYEVTDVGSPLFFQSIDAIKRTDVERFALGYWEFDRFPGRKVLDIGCGPGWLTVQYAHGGATSRPWTSRIGRSRSPRRIWRIMA